MSIHEESQEVERGFALALIQRMRRRTGRVGVLMTFLTTLAAAFVVFVFCACKTFTRR
jgi:hypothetical protein